MKRYSPEDANSPGIHPAMRHLKIEEIGMDRNRKKDILIDSLSKSDMITCLPGFKKKVGTVRTAFPKLKSTLTNPEGISKNKRGKPPWDVIKRERSQVQGNPTPQPTPNPPRPVAGPPQNYQGQTARQNYPVQMTYPTYPGQVPYNYPGQMAYQNYAAQAQLPRQNYPGQMPLQNYYGQMGYQNYPAQIPYQNYAGQMQPQNYPGQMPQPQNYPGQMPQSQNYQGQVQQQQQQMQQQQQPAYPRQVMEDNYQQVKNFPQHLMQQEQAKSTPQRNPRLDPDEDKEDVDEEFEALKEQTTKPQRIWQTSDELPDPALKTAVYKVELCKQIVEDRKRKAERVAREKEEDERMERKIREFHERERRRMEMEQMQRAELEGRYNRRNKIEKQRRRNEAFTISRQEIERGPRSRSSALAEKLAHFGPSMTDYDEPTEMGDPYYNAFADDSQNFSNNDQMDDLSADGDDNQPTRKSSPPIPVVRKKLFEGEAPRRQISTTEQDFFKQLKTKLHSERDLVERRLQEKLESTHKNMNLLKYTMSQNKLAH